MPMRFIRAPEEERQIRMKHRAEMPRLSGLKTSTLLLVTQTFTARFILG